MIESMIRKSIMMLSIMVSAILVLVLLIIRDIVNYGKNEIIASPIPSVELAEEDLKIVDKELMIEDCMNNEKYSSDAINQKINELTSSFKSDSKAFSFCYTDLSTNNSFCENENGYLFAASVTKAPVNIYIYELASEGGTDLDTMLTFTASHKRDGTGILKKKPLNTKYTVRELVEYSTKYSDNSAHSMLVSKYGKDNIKKFWKEMGSKTIFMDNTLFSKLSAKDGNIYMEELYKFYLESDYGKELMGYFKNINSKFINIKGLEVAHKYGWTNNYLHDSAIVFDERPFALTIMSTKGDSDYKAFFTNTSSKVYEIHRMYWNEKKSYCENLSY